MMEAQQQWQHFFITAPDASLRAHPIGDVEDDDRSCSSTVVHGRERVIALLPRRVPDLELDRRVVERDRLREEGGTDRRLLVLKELAADEAQHERRLADGRIAEEDEFELEDAADGSGRHCG